MLDRYASMQLQKEIAELLNEETDVGAMLNGALQLLLEAAQFDTGWIFIIRPKAPIELAASAGLPPALAADHCRHLRKGGCSCVSLFHSGGLQKASNIIACQRIERAERTSGAQTDGITHHATVRLQSGREPFGLLNVASQGCTSYTEEELALLETVAFQIGSALKRMRLTEEERERARLDERNRLAQDLHDAVNQLLFSVGLTARGALSLTEEPAVRDALEEISSLNKEALAEMRALIWQLRPASSPDIAKEIERYADRLGIRLRIKQRGEITLSPSAEVAALRIAQEGLNNVRKHAGTNEACASLLARGRWLTLTIEDEGVGFLPAATAGEGLGLSTMKERAQAVGGSFALFAAPGVGTRLTAVLPLLKKGDGR